MQITLEETAAALKQAERVVLTAHVSPDGDALGSCLGLQAYLRQQGKSAEVLIDDKLPHNLAFLPGYAAIRRPQGLKLEADLLVVLDTAPDRIGEVQEAVPGAALLNIDHHISNDGKDVRLYCPPRKAAVAETVYDILQYLGAELDEAMALSLYTGLATDTGFFRYSNTTPATMRVAAALIEAGARPELVSETVEEKPYQLVMGMAKAMQTIELFADGKAAGVFLPLELVETLDSTDGFIDFARIIEGVEIAVLVKCVAENTCRVSLRSKGRNVSKIAMEFGGGGHIRAAGCTLKMPLAEAKATIMARVTAAVNEE